MADFAPYYLRVSKKNSRIQVTLQGYPASYPLTSFLQGYCPVHTQRVTTGVSQGFQMCVTGFTK